jgi:hypothetical protein
MIFRPWRAVRSRDAALTFYEPITLHRDLDRVLTNALAALSEPAGVVGPGTFDAVFSTTSVPGRGKAPPRPAQSQWRGQSRGRSAMDRVQRQPHRCGCGLALHSGYLTVAM